MSHIRASPLLPIAANHLCQRHQGDRLDRVQPSLAQTLALPSPSPLPAEKAAASHHRRCLYCYHTTATTQPLSTVASHLLCRRPQPTGKAFVPLPLLPCSSPFHFLRRHCVSTKDDVASISFQQRTYQSIFSPSNNAPYAAHSHCDVSSWQGLHSGT
ncbi:hypothetical protein GW17_00025745, partial [Ensete ventricosum]